MKLIRVILIPFSIIYSIIIFFRNKFYDFGIFGSEKLSKPVVSIGNITTGGTGKTPFTIFVSQYFLQKGMKVGIVSRGYKRKSDKVEVVCDGVNINTNVSESGDELILIAEELIQYYKNNFFIAAGNNRYEAANYLVKKFDPDIIILDDAFQHRKINRDLDLVMVDSQNFLKERFLNAFTLPSGILRENYLNLSRADVIIQNNKDTDLKIISRLELYGKEISVLRYKTEYFMDNKNSILGNYRSDAIVFSGIADDRSFVSMVRDTGLNAGKAISFPDHHTYNESDIESLIGKFAKGKIFVTTEKDFIKIRQFEKFVNEYPVYFLKMKTEVSENADVLYKKLDALINEDRHNKI
ncbi:MAG: tetraacyldisaccharide 4'-kinase [Ignavibacteria bacterium]